MLFTQSPQTITPGARVMLYEQNGVVRYYSLEQPTDAIQSVQAQLKEQQATLSDVATLKASMAEFQTLQKNLVDLQSQLSTKDQELTTLCSQVQDLTQKQVTVDVAATQAKMAEMEAELNNLRSFRDEVTKFMQSKGG
jgi:seryl-tRNA synthetase